MALFKTGHFERIGMKTSGVAKPASGPLKVLKTALNDKLKYPSLLTADAVKESSFAIQPPTLDLAVSQERWGLKLNSLTLKESFEGLVSRAFNPTNEIYFTSVAWDYSGQPPFMYPPTGAQPSDFIIPMKEGQKARFIGNGIDLFPARKVTGSLNVVLVVFEWDGDQRDLGEQMVAFSEAVSGSNLVKLITAISATPALATGVAVGQAVNELVGVIGKLMKQNGDDYVELFEGSYGTDYKQSSRTESYENSAADIELSLALS